MELEAERFYVRASEQAQDVGVRRLLGDLAEEERNHEKHAIKLTDEILKPDVRAEEDKTRRRMFLLQYVQPGLAGLMDGSVSTLAPLFAAAFATHQNWQTFLVGLAASIGAGISMGFAEALSDDGSLTGRGSPWLRGITCGAMTTLGGLGHTMPYLVPDSLGQRVLDCHGDCLHRRVLRALGDRLHSCALHGHTVPAGGVPDRARRRHRARGRDTDRRGVEHDPEKCEAVFRKDHAQTKSWLPLTSAAMTASAIAVKPTSLATSTRQHAPVLRGARKLRIISSNENGRDVLGQIAMEL